MSAARLLSIRQKRTTIEDRGCPKMDREPQQGPSPLTLEQYVIAPRSYEGYAIMSVSMDLTLRDMMSRLISNERRSQAS